MANEPTDQTSTLLRSVIRMLDTAANDGTGYDSLIPVLSLVCLVSILNRGQPAAAAPAPAANPASPAGPANPASVLQKLLADLGKGEGSIGPETLMSLLPLLNSPQVKNKLNPATLSTIMTMLGNIGSIGGGGGGDKGEKTDKGEKPETKTEKSDKSDDPEKRPAPPAAAVTSLDAIQQETNDPLEADKRGLGRYLNWKSNF